jgi:alkyl hydroperoxide reductase subunit AhpF
MIYARVLKYFLMIPARHVKYLAGSETVQYNRLERSVPQYPKTIPTLPNICRLPKTAAAAEEETQAITVLQGTNHRTHTILLGIHHRKRHILVLFPSAEQNSTAGMLLCPATQNCAMFKNRSLLGLLGGLGWAPESTVIPPQTNPAGAYLHTWLSLLESLV